MEICIATYRLFIPSSWPLLNLKLNHLKILSQCRRMIAAAPFIGSSRLCLAPKEQSRKKASTSSGFRRNSS